MVWFAIAPHITLGGMPKPERRRDTMNLEIRRQLLGVLSDLGEYTPDVRFGQLLANLSYMAKGFTAEALWDVEDEELLEAAKSHLEELSERHAGAS